MNKQPSEVIVGRGLGATQLDPTSGNCVIFYIIFYRKGIFLIHHDIVCSCILSRVDQLRSHFERCWNPLPWDPTSGDCV